MPTAAVVVSSASSVPGGTNRHVSFAVGVMELLGGGWVLRKFGDLPGWGGGQGPRGRCAWDPGETARGDGAGTPTPWGAGGKRVCRGDTERDGRLSPLGAGAGGWQGRAQHGPVSLRVPWARACAFTSTEVAKVPRTDPLPAAGGGAASHTRDGDSAGVKGGGGWHCATVSPGCGAALGGTPGVGVCLQWVAGTGGDAASAWGGTGTMGQEGTEPVP